jgi:hypothetical protein
MGQFDMNQQKKNVNLKQQNYVTFSSEKSPQEKKIEQEAEEIANETRKKFNEDAANIQTQIQTYKGIFLNYENVVDLYEKYKRENSELFIELKDETNDILTNERKTYYEDQQIDSLKFYYYYFLMTVYVICVISFGIFSLIYPSQITTTAKIVMFLILIALPFISTFILGIIIYLIYELYNLLPKNAYR